MSEAERRSALLYFDLFLALIRVDMSRASAMLSAATSVLGQSGDRLCEISLALNEIFRLRTVPLDLSQRERDLYFGVILSGIHTRRSA